MPFVPVQVAPLLSAFGASSTFTVNTSGTYRIAVKDRCGNQTSSSDITVTIPTKAVVTGVTKNTSCGPTTINVTFSSVPNTPYYSVDGANFSPTIGTIGIGTHDVRVADFNAGVFGCASDPFSFFVGTTPSVTNPLLTSAPGGVFFSEAFTQTGGEAPISYTTVSVLPNGLTLSTAGVLGGTPIQSGTFPIVVTATDANGCIGTGSTYNLTITCLPPTAIATPASQSTCSGSAITTIVLSGTATSFSWTRDNTVSVTGIAASGSGDISGTLTNTTSSPVTVTFTINSTDGTCSGVPITATVVVSPQPSTATAGPDQSSCQNPTATMAANTPVSGTGVWTQIAGPVTATIFLPRSSQHNYWGLNTLGTYPFRWTISSAPCTASFDDVDIVVNPLPAAFTLAGGGIYCPGTVTLTGPVDPNYTYGWASSLTGIASPNSFTVFGGTTSTQDVTASSVYRLSVTNQFGCSASDTAAVSLSDYVFTGSLAVGDAQQTGRLNRFANLSTCAAPKACPLTFTTGRARFYDNYTITNPRNVPVCATISVASSCGYNFILCGLYTSI
ncbi:MAG: hypothetical protein IPP93_06535 [Chitinophagaceae bacterium]|nr:hypothetical protein [Chitinophagaceae bacterium]